MRKNNRVVPWFTGSGSILTLAGAVMLMLAWGCSKSADTPPEKPPAAPAASPEAGAPQTAVETPAPQPAAAPETFRHRPRPRPEMRRALLRCGPIPRRPGG